MPKLTGVIITLSAVLLGGCVSTRVGPRVGMDFPTGSGGFNTVAGVTAEGWYSPSGFVRIDPQVKTLHVSRHVQEELGSLNAFKMPTVDAVAQSSATFIELPIMVGFNILNSSRFQPIVAFGGSLTSRLTSTTTTKGVITSYPIDGGVETRVVDETHSENTHSALGFSFCALAGVAYALTPALDLRVEVRGSYMPAPTSFWEPINTYVAGSPYTSFTMPEFSASLMCSAIFRL